MKNLQKIKLFFDLGQMLCEQKNVELSQLKHIAKMIDSTINIEMERIEEEKIDFIKSKIIDGINKL
jgi:hypothetical protein